MVGTYNCEKNVKFWSESRNKYRLGVITGFLPFCLSAVLFMVARHVCMYTSKYLIFGIVRNKRMVCL